jgi:hypothetical protein
MQGLHVETERSPNKQIHACINAAMPRKKKEKQKSPSSNATKTQRTQNYKPYLYNPS